MLVSLLLATLPLQESARPVVIAGTAFETLDATPAHGGWPCSIRDPRTGIVFRLVEPGVFPLGAPAPTHRIDEGPQVEAGLSRPYYLAETETTVGQWKRFVAAKEGYRSSAERTGLGLTRDGLKGEPVENAQASWGTPLPERRFELVDEHPVTQMAWNDAWSFCAHYGYRLPTEAEWERACRAGAETRFWWGDDERAADGRGNFADTAARAAFEPPSVFRIDDGQAFLAPVASYAANPWGFHDMLGNVFEWCADAYDPARFADTLDPRAVEERREQDPYVELPEPGAPRVLRGGAWTSGPLEATCWSRAWDFPARPGDARGFRVAFTPGEAVLLDFEPAPGDEPDELGLKHLSSGKRRIRADWRRSFTGHPVLTGRFRRWHSTTKLAESGRVVDGERRGAWKFNGTDGELAAKGSFRNGQRHGQWELFHAGGAALGAGEYEDGRLDGVWEFWAANGALDTVHSGHYAYRDGPSERGALLDGQRHGPWVLAWEDGVPRLAGSFLRGKRSGRFRFWHPEGTFDPEMISGEWLAGRRLARAGTIEGIELGELPRAELVRRVQAPREDKEVALLLDGLRGAQGQRVTAVSRRLAPFGRKAYAAVLGRLLTLDLSQPSDVAYGARLMTALEHVCRGRRFAWSTGATAADLSVNRFGVLRAVSLWLLTREDRVFWELELHGAPSDGLLLELPDTVPPVAGRSSAEIGKRLRRQLGSSGEQALVAALAWLVAHQSTDGSWSTHNFAKVCGGAESICDGPGSPHNDVGVTGLALMALLGAGNTLFEGPHAEAVHKGVEWLLHQQITKKGVLLGNIGAAPTHGWIYQHPITMLALAKAHVSVPSRRIEQALEKAVDFIHGARNPYGAWRYDVPPIGDNDTSITGWMTLALLAARDRGIAIDPAALDGALEWIDEVSDPANGRVGYDSVGSLVARTPENEHFPREKSEAMTAVGLRVRLALGQDPGLSIAKKHADLMLRTLPEWDPDGFGCDMYYWYHGTYALYEMGGSAWKKWDAALRAALLQSQRIDGHAGGSWDPAGPWAYEGGRVYSTAMMALCLLAYAD